MTSVAADAPAPASAAPPGTGRNRAMDVLKAFGILSVVLAHATPPAIVVEVVQIYYIAVFFFVAGYFFKAEYFADFGALLRTRLLPLYGVFVAWNLSYLAYETALVAPLLGLVGVDLGPAHELSYAPRAAAAIILKGSPYSMGGALWFVTSLIAATVLFAAIGWLARRLPERVSPHAVRLAVLACFFAGFGGETLLPWPAFGDTALVGLLVLYAGYRYRTFETRVPLVPVVAVVCAAEVFVLRGTVDMTVDTYRDMLSFVVAVGAGIYALLWAASLLERSKVLNYIGRNTLFIAATHFVAFKVVALAHIAARGLPLRELARFPVIPDGNWWLAYFAGGVIIPLALKATVIDRWLISWRARPRPGRQTPYPAAPAGP